jgi:hypothetical protein
MIEEENFDFIKNGEMYIRLLYIEPSPAFDIKEQVVMELCSEAGMNIFLMNLSLKEAEILTGLKEKDIKGKAITLSFKCSVKEIRKMTSKQIPSYLATNRYR